MSQVETETWMRPEEVKQAKLYSQHRFNMKLFPVSQATTKTAETSETPKKIAQTDWKNSC